MGCCSHSARPAYVGPSCSQAGSFTTGQHNPTYVHYAGVLLLSDDTLQRGDSCCAKLLLTCHAKYDPLGSIWYSCGPLSSYPASSRDTPNGRTPPDSATTNQQDASAQFCRPLRSSSHYVASCCTRTTTASSANQRKNCSSCTCR
jgi:hypothetical protein